MLTSFHFGRAIWTATSQLLQSFKVLSCSVVPDFSDACRSVIEKSNIFGSLNLIFELTEKTIQSFLVFKSYFSHRQIHFHWDSEVFPFLNSRTCDQSLIADFYHLVKKKISFWCEFYLLALFILWQHCGYSFWACTLGLEQHKSQLDLETYSRLFGCQYLWKCVNIWAPRSSEFCLCNLSIRSWVWQCAPIFPRVCSLVSTNLGPSLVLCLTGKREENREQEYFVME